MSILADFSRLTVWWLSNPEHPVRVGALELQGNGRSCLFSYDQGWIQSGGAEISPEFEGVRSGTRPIAPIAGDLHSVFEDCGPDRWGRLLIRRLEKPPRLSSLDFLFLSGDQRFGALGFSIDPNRYEVGSAALPTLESLEELSSVFDRVSAGERVDERQRRLIVQSRSLGGARPKALVPHNGRLWVAKFPQIDDAFDVSRVEHASQRLQAIAGISSLVDSFTVPVSRRAPQRGSVFLSPRFDRTLEGHRIHAISARTLTIAEQNAAPEIFSYTGLAEALRQRGAAPEEDCRELYRRMVFNILIENTDDHEKNHAFLLTERGWRLSPSFDALPQGLGMGFQSMAINAQGQTAASTQAILASAPAFLLSQSDARALAAEVASAVSSWRVTFAECGVSEIDIDTLATFIDSPSLRSIREEMQSSPAPIVRTRSRKP